MAKNDLILKSDLAFANQLQLFKLNIGKYAAVLGLTPAQVAAQAADADFYQYVIHGQQAMLSHSQSWTVLRKTLRKGDSTLTDPATATATAPAPDPSTDPPSPGTTSPGG